MNNAIPWVFASVALVAASCGSNSDTPGDGGSSTPVEPVAFDACLRRNGWSPPAAPGAWSNLDLAVRVAAVEARCQPTDAELDGYVKRLSRR